jgi:hypothetical protein
MREAERAKEASHKEAAAQRALFDKEQERLRHELRGEAEAKARVLVAEAQREDAHQLAALTKEKDTDAAYAAKEHTCAPPLPLHRPSPPPVRV